ncbi:MAG: HD domain-containing protein, partial [Desulfovermiculus sp.]|nr:HD domain-containing protein [Desulfovermiculus sp.]
AVEISKELGMDHDFQYRVRVAALLHDYGKIAVPDNILKKPDKLTDEEYEKVKYHAIQTEKILQQIQLEGTLEQVPKIAGSHHERLDGSGYPRGLRGKDIPLESQIIAVADVFEAITATRHYREPMPITHAFHLLFDLGGIQFDQKIVNALYRYYIRDIDPHLSLELDKGKYAVSS